MLSYNMRYQWSPAIDCGAVGEADASAALRVRRHHRQKRAAAVRAGHAESRRIADIDVRRGGVQPLEKQVSARQLVDLPRCRMPAIGPEQPLAQSQDRAEAGVAWHVRRVVAAGRTRAVPPGSRSGSPAPIDPWLEDFPAARRRRLVAFAFATWLYRLIIFVGIAIAVYLFFFKALGILLFAVEIAWFIALPVWRELRIWYERRTQVPTSRRRRLALLALAALLLLAIPWKSEVRGHGLAHATRQQAVFSPFPAQIKAVRPAGPVAAGELLAELDAPDLRLRSLRNEASLRALDVRLTGLQAQDRGIEQAGVTAGRLDEQVAELRSAADELGRLALRAGFAGLWLDTDRQQQAGVWIGSRAPLGILVDPQRWQVEAYVGQDDVDRLQPGATALFYPERSVQAIAGKLIEVDRTRAATIAEPVLTTRHGGPIPLAPHSEQAVPAEARFRVRIALAEAPPTLRETRGAVVIDGERRSLLGQAATTVLATLIRESGF